MTLQKLLFHFLRVTILSFSGITLTVIPSAAKIIDVVSYILFTALLTAQRVKQTFIVGDNW